MKKDNVEWYRIVLYRVPFACNSGYRRLRIELNRNDISQVDFYRFCLLHSNRVCVPVCAASNNNISHQFDSLISRTERKLLAIDFTSIYV